MERGPVDHERFRALGLALEFLSCPNARVDERVSGDVIHTTDVALSIAEKFLDWSRR